MLLKGRELESFVLKKYFKNETLSEYDEAIKFLLSTCDTKEKLKLVEHIIDNITIYTDKQVGFAVSFIMRAITKDIKISDKVAIVATAFDGDSDSSQHLMYKIKPLLRDHKNISLFSYMPKFLKCIRDYNKAFIMDDFSGTGNTLIHRHKTIMNAAKQASHQIECQCVLVAAMENAVKSIDSAGIKTECMDVLRAGISGYFAGDALKEMSDTMISFEAELKQSIDETELPTFGYGKAESMFSIHRLNAPNSNFPLLWWPENRDGSKRNTIFSRNQ